jgi:hypothetical protein
VGQLTLSISEDAIAVDGDASTYLEELIVGDLPTLTPTIGDAVGSLPVEVVGPHLRLEGTMRLGYFRRISDFLNNHDGLIELGDATILRRNGDPTKVRTPSIWLSPTEVTLVGQRGVGAPDEGPSDLRVSKAARSLIVVTPGHTLTGQVYVMPDATLSVFIESSDPTFIPMTDVRTRSLADRRIIARYEFGLLNRRHIVAATELLPGMAPSGRGVL